ncbi:nitroreductase family protein [soil metagenome]
MPAHRAPQPGAENLSEPMRSRWSPAWFDPNHTLTTADLSTVLSAARWAPSWGNVQPWSFVVLHRGSPAHNEFLQTLTEGNLLWAPNASALVVAATQIAPNPDGKGGMAPDYHRYDLGQAVAHLSLQAVAIGLAAHQFAGFDHDTARHLLGIPDWFAVDVAVALGRHGDPADLDPEVDAALLEKDQERPRKRKPLASIVHDGHWGTRLVD